MFHVIYLDALQLEFISFETKQKAFDFIEKLLIRNQCSPDNIHIIKGDRVLFNVHEVHEIKLVDAE